MKLIQFLLLLVLVSSSNAIAQNSVLKSDTLITISANPEKGFNFDYFLYLPEGLDKAKLNTVLIEPNNTGSPSKFMEIHFGIAAFTAA